MFGFSAPVTPSPDVITRGRTVTKYVIVHQSRLDNIMDFAGGFLIGFVGWLLGLETLQWFGAAVALIMVISRVFQPENTYTAYSIEDARRVLDMLDEEDEG